MKKFLAISVLMFLAACGEVDVTLTYGHPSGEFPEEVKSHEVAVTATTDSKKVFVSSSLEETAVTMTKTSGFFAASFKVTEAVKAIDFQFNDGTRILSGSSISVFVDGVRNCNWKEHKLNYVVGATSQVCEEKDPPVGPTCPGDPECPNPVTRKDGMLATAEEMFTPLSDATYRSIVETTNIGRMEWMTRDIEVLSFDTWREQMRQLKSDAPGLTVACYMNQRELMSLSGRPWQYAMYNDLITNHPDWFLHWSDGSIVVSYTDPGGTFEMYMLNVMLPEVRAYLVTKIIEITSRPENVGICDEIHYDNFSIVVMWILDWLAHGRQLFDHDGNAFTRWGFESQMDTALQALADETVNRTGLTVSGRTKDQVLLQSSSVSGAFFEDAFKSDIPPSPVFGGIMQARMMAKAGFCVVHHDARQLLDPITHQPYNPATYDADRKKAREDGFAGGIMSEGCAYTNNEYGSWGNGGWVADFDVEIDLGGQCEVELPYGVRYQLNGINTMIGGQSLSSFDSMNGDLMFFWRRIVGGTETSSHLIGLNGSIDDGLWAAGLWSSYLDGGPTTIGFTGWGTLTLEDLIVFDAANPNGKGYFHAICPKAEAWANVSSTVKNVTGLNGQTYTLQPSGVIGWGKVVAR